MKWLSLFKKRSKEASRSEEEHALSSELSDDDESASKRRSVQVHSEVDRRGSLQQWFEARRARTSIDVNNTTTTETLQVCKAGVTTLINRTYIVIKHLGSGTYGRVKLAFNLRDRKLYAIKACKKSQVASRAPSPRAHRAGGHGSRGFGGMRLRRSIPGANNRQPPPSSCSFNASSPQPAASTEHKQSTRGYSMPTVTLSASQSATSTTATSAGGVGSYARPQPVQIPLHPVRSGATSPDTAAIAGAGNEGGAILPGRESEVSACLKAEEFVREIAIMKKLTHPNIVKLVEVIDDPASDNLLLVMEYVEGESLHPKKLDATHWEKVPEHEVWRRARDVLQGLDYLHFHEVVHGDLKPANLMMDANSRQVKIVDFGSAVFSSAAAGRVTPANSFLCSSAAGMSCTPAFRSPESLQSGYSPSTELDMWALGVTLYMWVFGELPFNGIAPFMVYESIKRQELRIPPHTRISAEFTDFLRKLLDKDPSQRASIVDALQHAWITGMGTAPLPVIEREGLFSGGESEVSDLEEPSARQGPRRQQHGVMDMAESPSPEAEPRTRTRVNITGRSTRGCSVPLVEAAWHEDARVQVEAAGRSGMSFSDGSAPRMGPPLVHGGPACVSGEGLVSASLSEEGGLARDSLLDEDVVMLSRHSMPMGQEQEAETQLRARDERAASAAAAGPSSDKRPSVDLGSSRHKRVSSSRGRKRNACYVRAVSKEELELAISASVGGAAVSELMGMMFEEVKFSPGQQIIHAGDPLDRIYLIAQGEVEIYHDVVQDPEGGMPHMDPGQPLIVGLEGNGYHMDSEDEEEAAVNFLTEGGQDPGGQQPHLYTLLGGGPVSGQLPVLPVARGSAVSTARVNGNHSGPLAGYSSGLPNSLVVGVKGPGDSLGLASLSPKKPEDPVPTWRANVRARGEVGCFMAEVDTIHDVLQRHPELESAMRNIAVQQETDFKVAEALRQLRLHHRQLQLQQMAQEQVPGMPQQPQPQAHLLEQLAL
mmetsp:Transcript_35580/g.79024  ORF Transcript_35580/g.79024 Transcript_35580/m.79024 type:complete len:994 (+) Transcript_35580:258-3239(+)|eukprot:CAMPEP_0202897578 /NCGR_PEP_ID=MMETSP1392-20130828/6299_1 /ASSEMBLY_ACC=CAM_ASM_000868 /TAXON_ID=225041 /ORGANISM="Chlamydomonas chlamydogama, Strain SAG 11-48b" /LENGTH=993 /DNA_ID=CAMNT_0049583261 /DNA_START=239 /DNA_END=3220 /DNA_ORIENTATION=+